MLVLKKPGDTNSRGIPARIVLDKPTTTLGRNSSASDVFINSQSRPHMISRVHAKIKRNEATGAYTMTSHGMNGVLVNGVKTDRAELKDGDVVVFGGSGMETRVGQRVKEPDSDLVYCFSAVSENDETRCLETSTDQSAIITTSGCGDESQDTSQMSQSVLKEGKIGESDVPTSSSPITKTGLEGQAENSQSDDQTSLIKEKEKESIEEAGSSKSKLLEDLNEELICCICRELICVAHTLPCSHAFCKDCIRGWLKQSKECPTCRAKASFDKAIPVKMLDNAIDRVAASMLSEEEQKEREKRVQRLLHDDEPAAKKKKMSPKRMVTRRAAAVETVVISSDSSESDSEESEESVLTIEESEDDVDVDVMEMCHYGVEHSRSSRARCRVCRRPISLRVLRWFCSGVEPGGPYDYTHYFHFDCYRPPRHVTYEQVSVYGLSVAEKEQVRQKLWVR